MRRINAYLSFTFVCLIACPACQYLEADDKCVAIMEVTSCHAFDTDLDHCDPYAEVHAPGCHIEEAEKCTDYSEVDKSERDGKTGVVCKDVEVCTSDRKGEDDPPVSCPVLDMDRCLAAVHCEWYNDPNNVDRDAE